MSDLPQQTAQKSRSTLFSFVIDAEIDSAKIYDEFKNVAKSIIEKNRFLRSEELEKELNAKLQLDDDLRSFLTSWNTLRVINRHQSVKIKTETGINKEWTFQVTFERGKRLEEGGQGRAKFERSWETSVEKKSSELLEDELGFGLRAKVGASVNEGDDAESENKASTELDSDLKVKRKTANRRSRSAQANSGEKTVSSGQVLHEKYELHADVQVYVVIGLLKKHESDNKLLIVGSVTTERRAGLSRGQPPVASSAVTPEADEAVGEASQTLFEKVRKLFNP